MRRLILALPEIRPPDRARTPLSIDSAPAIDQPSANEDLGAPNPARRAKTEGVGPGEESGKSAPSPRPLAPAPSEHPQRSRRARSGARPRETPHIARSTETRKQKNRPLNAQASRVEPAARRLLFGSGPARAAATSKEWEAGDGADGAAARAAAPNVGEVIDGKQWQFNAEQIIGNGSFGVVFRATIVETGAVVAIKKVLQVLTSVNNELQHDVVADGVLAMPLRVDGVFMKKGAHRTSVSRTGNCTS